MNIENFIPKYLREVRNFCVEDLAGILYRCVEHNHEPRAEADWLTAENYIRTQPVNIIEDFTKKFLFLTCYEELRKKRTHLPSIVVDHYNKASQEEIEKIKERIVFLDDSEFFGLVDALGFEQRKNYQKLFLGRDVWNLFYQTIQKTDVLKSGGYLRVIFG